MRTDRITKESKKEKERSARKRKINTQSITDIAIAAREAGMSYGQYVAKHNL